MRRAAMDRKYLASVLAGCGGRNLSLGRDVHHYTASSFLEQTEFPEFFRCHTKLAQLVDRNADR